MIAAESTFKRPLRLGGKNDRVLPITLKGPIMTPRFSLFLTSLALVAAAPAPAAESADAGHHHGHAAAAAQQLRLNAGKKWATDAPLRQSMREIDLAMREALPQIRGHRFGDGDYRALSATIERKVGYVVANCKLEPQADAMLHVLLGDLLAGARAMAGNKAEARDDGAERVFGALKDYGKFFRHPGWQAAAS